MIKYCFFDTETHDIENPRMIQLATSMYHDSKLMYQKERKFKPPVPITIGAMSVHHITQLDIEDAEPVSEQTIVQLQDVCDQYIMIAHNLKFDTEVFKNEGITVKSGICTLKVAMSLFPDLEQYKLQYLRYLFNVRDAEVRGMKAHDAMVDVMILEKVFFHLFNHLEMLHPDKSHAALFGIMEDITANPLLLHRILFGKYKGQTFEEIAAKDKDYLRWLRGSIRENPKPDPDLLHTVEHYAS